MLLAWLLYGRPLAAYRLLDHRLVRFYGRISYSFYLLHFPVLYWTTLGALHLVRPDSLLRWPNLWAAGLGLGSVALATPLAWLLYLGAEKPGIALSKCVCDSLRAARQPSLVRRKEQRGHAEEPAGSPTAAPVAAGK